MLCCLSGLRRRIETPDNRSRSEKIDLEGTTICVATPDMLYEMKRDTVRPIDKADAAALRDAFGIEEH
jgi:hypothetical protein